MVVYVAQLYRVEYRQKLSRREQLLIAEIGTDSIDAASRFVDYISDVYGFSKSSVWYVLNRLKEKSLIEFASKEEVGKPLYLTKTGIEELRMLERMSIRKRIIGEFSAAYLQQGFRVDEESPYMVRPGQG